MKKVLTTVAGLLSFAVIGTACGPAVDTQETTSTTPIAASMVPAQRVENIRQQVDEFKISRSATRPTATPVVSTHENHVNVVKNQAAVKAAAVAKAKRIAHAKAVKAAQAKVYRIHLAKVKAEKAAKAKLHNKTVQAKKVVKKVHKTYTKAKKVSLSGIASCIAKYESGGNPRAQNPHSSASGLFQFVDGTWNNFGGYARAMYAPISVQLQKFYIVWDGGRGAGNWVVAHKCGY